MVKVKRLRELTFSIQGPELNKSKLETVIFGEMLSRNLQMAVALLIDFRNFTQCVIQAVLYQTMINSGVSTLNFSMSGKFENGVNYPFG